MICAHPELIGANAETVKPLLLIATLQAWLSNINTDAWLILNSTRPAQKKAQKNIHFSEKVKR